MRAEDRSMNFGTSALVHARFARIISQLLGTQAYSFPPARVQVWCTQGRMMHGVVNFSLPTDDRRKVKALRSKMIASRIFFADGFSRTRTKPARASSPTRAFFDFLERTVSGACLRLSVTSRPNGPNVFTKYHVPTSKANDWCCAPAQRAWQSR